MPGRASAGPVPCPLPSPSPKPSKVPSGSCRAFAPAAHRTARLLSHRRGLAENGPAGFHGRTEARAELRSCTVAALDQLDVYRAVGIKPPSGVLVCVPPPHAARPPQHSVLSAAPLRATPCKASITRSAVRVCVRVCVCVPVCAHACAFVCVRVLVRACVCAYLCVRAGTGKRRRDGGTAGFAMRWCSYGAAGTGKTSLVRAVCSESNVPSIVLNATEASEPHRLAAPRRPSPL